ncbi:hypothetical protein ACFLZP_05105, partial [Patescibacteria group bacterium]
MTTRKSLLIAAAIAIAITALTGLVLLLQAAPVAADSPPSVNLTWENGEPWNCKVFSLTWSGANEDPWDHWIYENGVERLWYGGPEGEQQYNHCFPYAPGDIVTRVLTTTLTGPGGTANPSWTLVLDDRPQLEVSKTPDRIAIKRGESVTYTVTITNQRSITASVALTDFLPSYLVVASSVNSQDLNCWRDTSQAVCYGEIPGNSIATAQVRMTPLCQGIGRDPVPDGDEMVNEVTVTSGNRQWEAAAPAVTISGTADHCWSGYRYLYLPLVIRTTPPPSVNLTWTDQDPWNCKAFSLTWSGAFADPWDHWVYENGTERFWYGGPQGEMQYNHCFAYEVGGIVT